MADRQPHVRVEMRKVYVFGKNRARFTKAQAYRHAAREIVTSACDCDPGEYHPGHGYEPHTGSLCRFHADCTCEPRQVAYDDFDPGYCAWHMKLPKHKRDSVGRHAYYVLVRDRLARFLAFVDRRSGTP